MNELKKNLKLDCGDLTFEARGKEVEGEEEREGFQDSIRLDAAWSSLEAPSDLSVSFETFRSFYLSGCRCDANQCC